MSGAVLCMAVKILQASPSMGTPVLLTMGVVDAGWTFTGWDGGGCSGTAPCTVIMNSNIIVTANFIQNQYILTVNSSHGAVTKNPDQATYTYGTPVLLTMGVVDAGWTFTGWNGGGCSGTAPCAVIMNSDTSVTANFTQNQYTLNLAVSGSGTIVKVPDQATYTYGQIVKLTAFPAASWIFIGWSGDISGYTNPTSIIIDGNKSITATFSNQITLRESFNSMSGWTVKGSPRPYSAVVDTINKLEGTGSIKLTHAKNGYVEITKTISWNLSNQNTISFWVYVPAGMPTSGSIILTNDSRYRNYYIVNYSSTTGPFHFSGIGWNQITLKQSDWTRIGSASWSSTFVGIRIRMAGATSNSYSFDYLVSAP
jgi:uncharacterized repeat protein (TIGR02543 family)